jgi:hypothetical protein
MALRDFWKKREIKTAMETWVWVQTAKRTRYTIGEVRVTRDTCDDQGWRWSEKGMVREDSEEMTNPEYGTGSEKDEGRYELAEGEGDVLRDPITPRMKTSLSIIYGGLG